LTAEGADGMKLIVTAGSGWGQRWDSERQEMKPGDVV
jgi:quercetin dioxygenase-like cupin family protein